MNADSFGFLKDDFSQSYQQLRHRDSQIIDVFKFLFTADTTVIGVSYGLFQFGIKEKVDLLLPCISIITLALILGLFTLLLITKNRIYFVKNARYLNVTRDYFTKHEDVPDSLKVFYTDPKKPKYFDYTSSQLVLLYFISISNSFLLFSLFYFLGFSLTLGLVLCIIFLSLQFFYVLFVLEKEEKEQI